MKSYEPISAGKRKLYGGLRQGKNRRKEGLFVMEGTRSVVDSAPAFEVEAVVATHAWLEAHEGELPKGLPKPLLAKNDEMERMSAMEAPQGVMAVCRIPQGTFTADYVPGRGELMMALDTVQDPGNLGTIVRIADWYGIRRIFASKGTADIFGAKAVQATMGAVARVEVVYCDLAETLGRLKDGGTAVYGTFLDGEDIYGTELTEGGVIVMGNEGNGISDEVGRSVTKRLFLPPYPAMKSGMESLNVAMAAAITVAEFRRRVTNV